MENGLPNIALWARSGSGKSFAAKYLVKRHGYQPCQPGEVCREITRRLFHEESKATLNKVNDALRAIDPNIWLRLGMEAVDDRREGVLIDGIRFRSNLEFCRERAFRLVKIEASQATRIRRLAERGQAFDIETDGEHAGETELEYAQFDYVIQNEIDNPENLYKQLDAIVGRPPIGKSLP